jgi:hypothetical protein
MNLQNLDTIKCANKAPDGTRYRSSVGSDAEVFPGHLCSSPPRCLLTRTATAIGLAVTLRKP